MASFTSSSEICHMAKCTTVSRPCINTSIWASVLHQSRKLKDWGLYCFKHVHYLLIWHLYALVKLVFLFTHLAERRSLACSLAGSCRQKGSGKVAKTGKTTRVVTSPARSKSKGWKARQSRWCGWSFFTYFPSGFRCDIYLLINSAQFYTTYYDNNI